MSAGKCPMGQSLGVSHGTAPLHGSFGTPGTNGTAGTTARYCPMNRRLPQIPAGSWPRRMAADLAAAYCGEQSVDTFLKRVGKDYPSPRVAEGRRRLWLRDDLDNAILPAELAPDRDVAGDL